METYIKTLWELQQVDIEILSIEKKKSEIPAKKRQLEAQLKSLEEEKAFKEENRDKVLAEKERREKEIEQENEKIKMVDSRLSHIRNQKDYLEIRKKIELAKKSNKLREDEVIRKMEEIEKLNKELEDFMVQYNEGREKILQCLLLYDNEIKELENAIEEILKKRNSITANLDAEILKTYEHLRKNCRGIGVSRARNESCEGCFMNLPPQLYNMVIKGDKLYHCPFCQRYLIYIPEEKKEGKE